MRHSQAKCLHHASEPAMEQKRVCFQSPLSGLEPRSMLVAPCLLILPAQFSLCSQLTAMLIKVGGSLVFTGKHKKQRQVPKCLTQKKALCGAWSQGTHCKALAETWGLRCHELCRTASLFSKLTGVLHNRAEGS